MACHVGQDGRVDEVTTATRAIGSAPDLGRAGVDGTAHIADDGVPVPSRDQRPMQVSSGWGPRRTNRAAA